MRNPKIGDRVRIKETNIKGTISSIDNNLRKLNFGGITNVQNVRVKLDKTGYHYWFAQEMLIRLIQKQILKPSAPEFLYFNIYNDGLLGLAYCEIEDLPRYQYCDRGSVISNPVSSRLVYKLVEEIPV